MIEMKIYEMNKNLRRVIGLMNLVLLLVLMVSCGLEDDIEGVWYFKNSQNYIEFLKDGACKISNSSEQGSWSIEDDELIITDPDGESEYLNVEFEDDMMILSNEGTTIRLYKNPQN